MLAAICLGTNSLIKAGVFYDCVLATLGMARLIENDIEIGYGILNQDPTFWVLLPYNKKPASSGNGSQVMLRALSPEVVNNFYTAALKLGGQDEGAPGLRDYADHYYGAYVRDLDGNKLHVFHLPRNI